MKPARRPHARTSAARTHRICALCRRLSPDPVTLSSNPPPPVHTKSLTMHIGVYCASSNHVADRFIDEAEVLGRLIAERNDTLVYGGGQVGLMGVVARSVHEHGGTVIGAIPQALKDREIGRAA